MKKVFLYLAAAVVLFSACKKEDEKVAVTGVQIEGSATVAINLNAERTLTVTVLPENADNQNVTWRSEPAGQDIISVTPNDQGAVIKANKRGEGIKIFVKTEEGGFEASVTVNVVDPGAVTGVEILMETTDKFIVRGSKVPINLKFTPENPDNKNVTWDFDSQFVNVTAKDASKGEYEVEGLLEADEITITVTTEDGEYTDVVVVNVVDPWILRSIELQEELYLEVNDAETISVTIIPPDARIKSIEWVSSDATVAKVTKKEGTDAEVEGLKEGTAKITVTVTSDDDEVFTAECEVEVKLVVLKLAQNWYLNAKFDWKDGWDVTRIEVKGTAGSAFTRDIDLTDAIHEAGFAVVSGLTPNTDYEATIFNADGELNTVEFKTLTVVDGEIDVPVWANLNDFVFNHARDYNVLKLDGGGAVYDEVRFRISTSITIKGGEGGTIIRTAGNKKMWGNNQKMDVIFDGIHFVYTGATGADIFNVDAAKGENGPSIDVKLIAFKNCIIEGFGRYVWQTSDNYDIVDEFLMENCIITGHLDGGNRRVINFPNASNKLGKVTIKNSTFVNVNRIVSASLDTAPTDPAVTEATVENCTFYDVATGTENLFDYNNKHAKVTISNSLFAKGKAVTSNIARTSGEKIATKNFHLNDFVPGNNSIPNIEKYDKTSDEVFTDPAKFDFSIKEATFKAEGVGDPWNKVLKF